MQVDKLEKLSGITKRKNLLFLTIPPEKLDPLFLADFQDTQTYFSGPLFK